MLTQLLATVASFLVAAGVLFQLAVTIRLAVRIARSRRLRRPRASVSTPKPVPVVRRRVRCREYRAALRAARLSTTA